ncbi:MAG: zf-HC2 domain-containing protein [Bacillaceae bacterium]|nr:zf-HC2 domain-containing protein [Bacillaceae bacterium]
MRCEEVVELIQRDLDADLSQEEKLKMNKHLVDCRECATLYEKMKNLSHGLEKLPDVKPAYSLVDAIQPELDKIDHGERRAVTSNRRRFGGWKTFSGVVAAAAVLILIWSGNNQQQMQQSSDAALEGGQLESAENQQDFANALTVEESASKESMKADSQESATADLDAGDKVTHSMLAPGPGEPVVISSLPSPSGVYIAEVKSDERVSNMVIRSSEGQVIFKSHQWMADKELDYNWESDQLIFYRLIGKDSEENWEIHLPEDAPPFEKRVLVSAR